MKVGVLTLHKVLNFGSVLQTYCTCVSVKKLGYDVEVINYMQPRYTVGGSIAAIWQAELAGAKGVRIPKAIARSAMRTVSYFLQRRTFETFVKGWLPVGKGEFTSFQAISSNPPDADIFLTGSDQVWNSEYNKGVDRCHYLDFAPQGKPRVAYAASFGKDSIPDSEKHETAQLLRKYLAVGVRESSGVDIVKSLGIEGAQHVLDPTMLLSRQDWESEFKPVRLVDEPYLLIYSVERSLDKIVMETAKGVAKARGLKILFLSQAAPLRSMKECDVQKGFASVQDFVSAFFFADYVVASSFHGTAFSINFNRQFVSVLPPRFGARPRSLLNLVGLGHRIIGDTFNSDMALQMIDFDAVNARLDAERAKSRSYLENSLRLASAAN